MREYLAPFFRLFFPQLCLACREQTPVRGEVVCLTCRHELPFTGQEQLAENAFTERFWGRVPLETGTALLYFSKSGKVQQLIHQLKYHEQAEVGVALGRWLGGRLKKASHLPPVDGLVPVPLHPRKQHQRGYNQAERIATGLAEVLEIPVYTDVLTRPDYALSQTQKSRIDRLESVQQAFALNPRTRLTHQHLMLVDDVLTTGATLEACAQQLLQLEGIKISMVTLAMAE